MCVISHTHTRTHARTYVIPFEKRMHLHFLGDFIEIYKKK